VSFGSDQDNSAREPLNETDWKAEAQTKDKTIKSLKAEKAKIQEAFDKEKLQKEKLEKKLQAFMENGDANFKHMVQEVQEAQDKERDAQRKKFDSQRSAMKEDLDAAQTEADKDRIDAHELWKKRERDVDDKVELIRHGSPINYVGEIVLCFLTTALAVGFCVMIDSYVCNLQERVLVFHWVVCVFCFIMWVTASISLHYSFLPYASDDLEDKGLALARDDSFPFRRSQLEESEAGNFRWADLDNQSDEDGEEESGAKIWQDEAITHVEKMAEGMNLDEAGDADSEHYEMALQIIRKLRWEYDLRNVVFSLYCMQFPWYLWRMTQYQDQISNTMETSVFSWWLLSSNATNIDQPDDYVMNLRVQELLAIMSHLVAILLGLYMIHRCYMVPSIFVSISDFFYRAFVFTLFDDNGAAVVKVDLAIREKIVKLGEALKELWLAASNLIDLVDVTDLFLLLIEEDLVKDDIPRFGCCTWWKLIQIIWFISATVLLLALPAIRLLNMLNVLILQHTGKSCTLERPMPDGLDMWRCFFAHSKKAASDEPDKSPEDLWRAAEAFYEFDFPRRQNNAVYWGAMRSLLFIELPFLFVRVFCSTKYSIMASSLLIKNVLSLIYDSYIVFNGSAERKNWRTAHEHVQNKVESRHNKVVVKLNKLNAGSDDGSSADSGDSDSETEGPHKRRVKYTDETEFLHYQRYVDKKYLEEELEPVVDRAIPTILSASGMVS